MINYLKTQDFSAENERDLEEVISRDSSFEEKLAEIEMIQKIK